MEQKLFLINLLGELFHGVGVERLVPVNIHIPLLILLANTAVM
jgi:hypothetical protein